MIGVLLSYWQVSWSLDLPEYQIWKSDDNCLVRSQGSLWPQILRSLFPRDAKITFAKQNLFLQGLKKKIFSKEHLDAEYRARVSDEKGRSFDSKIILSYWPKNGGLKISVQRNLNDQPLELQEIKIPFFKYKIEKRDLDIALSSGELDEHKINIAKDAELLPYDDNAPALLKNKKTELSVTDITGAPLKFDRSKFHACLEEESNKGALEFLITEMDQRNDARAKYIKNLENEARTYQYNQYVKVPRNDLDLIPWPHFTVSR